MITEAQHRVTCKSQTGGRDDRKGQGDITFVKVYQEGLSWALCPRDAEHRSEQLAGRSVRAGPLREEAGCWLWRFRALRRSVKSCLEDGRHDARRQVSWSDPGVEAMKKLYG